jgi:hypothetical protein
MSKILFAAAICASVFPAVAMAAPVSIDSDGSFNSLSSCNVNSNCRLQTTSNGSNTQVQWGTTSSRNEFVNPSTLTAIDINNTVSAADNNVKIAQLQWNNTAINSEQSLNSLDVNYAISITIGSASDSHTFDLTIVNPTNPPGDIIGSFTLGDLSNLTFSTAGWTIDQLHYAVDGGTTLCQGGTSWCNPENNTGNLYIEARFTPTPVTPVPEPVTLSLFGAGLIGAAALRRRKAAKA